MDENLKNLLDTDIGKISEDGRAKGKKRKKSIIIVAIACAIGIIIGWLPIRNKVWIYKKSCTGIVKRWYSSELLYGVVSPLPATLKQGKVFV